MTSKLYVMKTLYIVNNSFRIWPILSWCV